ncbi:hypothetical protein SBV1_3500001 [Verrucomicrobia bacterium]|nr:hypothetical protein SBV1_3500001 [Verrucomicrobiota bacterium]
MQRRKPRSVSPVGLTDPRGRRLRFSQSALAPFSAPLPGPTARLIPAIPPSEFWMDSVLTHSLIHPSPPLTPHLSSIISPSQKPKGFPSSNPGLDREGKRGPDPTLGRVAKNTFNPERRCAPKRRAASERRPSPPWSSAPLASPPSLIH